MPEASTQPETPLGDGRPRRTASNEEPGAEPAERESEHRPERESEQRAGMVSEPWARSGTLSAMAALVSATEVPWRHQPRPDYTAVPEPLGSFVGGQARAYTRIGVLLSGEGEYGPAISEAIYAGLLPGCGIAIVVSNVPGAAGLEAARAAGLPSVTIEGRGRDQADHEQALDALLRRMRVDLICLSGYRRTLSHAFLRRWPGRVVAVHPSLLPAFPGADAAAQALAYGAQVTGCTVSTLDDSHDGSPILLQRSLDIAEDETLESLRTRLLRLEGDTLVEALRRYTAGGWEMRGRRLVKASVKDVDGR